MSTLWQSLEFFHFIRPLWLLLLPAIALIWWVVRRRNRQGTMATASLAPHLRAALTVGGQGASPIRAIDGVALLLAFAALGAAGPTWSRVPDPFVAQTAPLVIALQVTSSMTEPDVAPTRLERGKQKIRDLLALRAGARTALVAYSGTAHRVVPMTDDPGVIDPYLQGLTPDVMPDEGQDPVAALTLARDILQAESGPGGILFVADSLAPADVSSLAPDDTASLALLATLPQGASDPGIAALTFPVEQVRPDNGDLNSLERSLGRAYQRALSEDGTQPWDDRGWLLAWPALALALIWFRRGWTMRWAVPLTLALSLGTPGTLRAEGIADWFLTPDQQGRLAYQQKDYDRAAQLFVDPMWKGRALYRDGQYEEAAKVYARIDTPDAAFAEGMSHIKSRAYRDAIAAFQTALERDPDFPGAAENLQTAKDVLDYVETAREQSDTGEERGIGADDVVMDNVDNRGADTQMEAPTDGDGILSADQWMNTVDTDTGDFLRQRFAVEAAR